MQDAPLYTMALMLELQQGVYAPEELLEILESYLSRLEHPEIATPYFPSIAALRLYAQREAAEATRGELPWAQQGAASTMDEACMGFLAFAKLASNTLGQPRILSDAVSKMRFF